MVNSQFLNTSAQYLKSKSENLKVYKVQLTPDGWTLNILSPRVATITEPKGKRKVSYFGFENLDQAQQFKQWLEEKHLCTGALVRRSERLKATWECKVWSASTELILNLALRSI